MFFWKNWKKKKPVPPPIQTTPPTLPSYSASASAAVPPASPAPAPLIPPDATTQELETTWQTRWRGQIYESAPWKELGMALAEHPNIPPHLLKQLIVLFPHAAAKNLAFPLILLEHPDFLSSIYPGVLYRWLRDETIPAILIQGLFSHPDPLISGNARYHVSVSGEAPDRWLNVVQDYIDTIPIKNEWALLEQAELGLVPMQLCLRLAGSRNGEIRAAMLSLPGMGKLKHLLIRASGLKDASRLGPAAGAPITLNELVWLGMGPYWFRTLAARHPRTPGATLAKLASDPDTFIRIRALRNLATPPDILQRFATSSVEAERIAVARNFLCPEDLLELLKNDSSERVRLVVAHRRASCRPSLRRKYTRERRLPMQETIARHPTSTPEERLSQATSAKRFDRLRVARDPQLSDVLRDQLATDPDPEVRRIARRYGGKSQSLVIPKERLLRILQIAVQPEVPSLATVSQDSDPLIRLALLARPQIAQIQLDQLRKDGHQWVRAAARRRSTTHKPIPLFRVVELP